MIARLFRPGIRARLWFALALLALSTLFVGGIGWYALDRADARLRALHSRTLSEVARSLRLSKQSSDLAISAPFLLNLKSSYLIQKEGQALIAALGPVLEEWPAGTEIDKEAGTEIAGTGIYAFDTEISLAVGQIKNAVSDLVRAAQTLDQERGKTLVLNTELFALENRFFRNLADGSAGDGDQRMWLALQTLTNELVGAGHAGNLLRMGERRRRFQKMQRDFAFLAESPVHLAWAERLNAIATGDNGLFEVRRRELSRGLETQNALFRIRANAAQISDLAAQFAANAEAFLADARRATANSIRFAKGLMLGILLASISIALVAALYVSGYVTGNIHAISDAMQRLAQGDRSTRLARKARRNDEIGNLLHSFRVFRANALRLDRSHRQLRQQNALFEQIFMNVSGGVAITNDCGQLTAMNPTLKKLLRPKRSRQRQQTMAELLARTAFAMPAAAAGLTAGFTGQAEITGNDGRILEVRCNRLPDGGGIWLFSDTTERHKMEERLRQIQHIESLGKVSGEVAHDFANVLSAVSANVHLLQTGSARVSPDTLLQRISNAVDIGTSLTQRLLAFARKQALAPEVVEINELIEGLAELISIGLKDGVVLETTPAPTPLYVRVDPGQLESAILNLCLNSNQAISGSGEIKVQVAKSGADTVQITVVDTGCGMDETVLAHSLEPFFSARKDGEGTGLGLSMVYGFIKQTGGDIQISSTPGAGTTVQLTLPLCAPKSGPPRAARRRALLVEDDPEALASVAAQLRLIGYEVTRAGSFEDGKAALKSGDCYDVLVTDLHLNDGHMGWALVDESLARCPGGKVVITSGRMPKTHRYNAAPHPMVWCIPKPLSAEILQEVLQ